MPPFQCRSDRRQILLHFRSRLEPGVQLGLRTFQPGETAPSTRLAASTMNG
ncbi:hypothetical protein USDA257_c21060 [Sinorhizobium fredii USDA 257]|uniref:Uncharacterized protein n=1 Tax=Sinorhizobium fredii (strain USDA 257) TaxID=1185652 RepID=I3X482_SINF2|nr:hypothetical protein USDA257_c21060 [Sinorhizobium fredii USDA 257]